MAEKFGISLKRLHYDPTHVLFTGAYANAEPREALSDDDALVDEARGAAQINKGRATDDAPKGARMVHAGIVSHIDELGVLPLFGHTIDGNQNGRTGIREQLALIQKLMKPPPAFAGFLRANARSCAGSGSSEQPGECRPPKITMISDRSTFSVAHLLRLKDAKSHALCSVPWQDVKELFEKERPSLLWKEAS